MTRREYAKRVRAALDRVRTTRAVLCREAHISEGNLAQALSPKLAERSRILPAYARRLADVIEERGRRFLEIAEKMREDARAAEAAERKRQEGT